MRTVESYKHLFAKRLLHKWLVEEEIKSGDYCKLPPIAWRRNQGIYMELPFHQSDDDFYFENNPRLLNVPLKKCKNGLTAYENPEACFESGVDRGKIVFIPDIVIFYKGVPDIIVEIVHRNPVSEEKLNKIIDFFDFSPRVYEVSADHILSHTQRPELLQMKQIL